MATKTQNLAHRKGGKTVYCVRSPQNIKGGENIWVKHVVVFTGKPGLLSLLVKFSRDPFRFQMNLVLFAVCK